MATISDNLKTLEQSKQDIKNAIINKGVTPEGGLVTYSAAIDKIASGGPGKIIMKDFPGLKLAHSSFTTFTNEEYDFSGVTDMSFMFSDCSFLSAIPLIDTSSCTNMSGMLLNAGGINGFTGFPLIDTSKVTNMSYMFRSCDKLSAIPLIDTSSCTNMSAMFSECTLLDNIPLLNTSKVTDMSYMFMNCNSLVTIPLIDTSSCTNMSYTFNNCSTLTTIPALNTSKVTDVNNMFGLCENLESIPELDFGSVVDIFEFFYYGAFLNKLQNLGGFKNLKKSWWDDCGLSRCPNLTKQSILNVLNGLYDFRANGDFDTTVYLQLNIESLKKLTDQDKQIAIKKGWTLTT